MGALRRQVALLACVWLCCQLSLLMAAPLSLVAGAQRTADAPACTCVHTGNAQCPMHHPATQKSGCSCRSTTDPGTTNIVSLLGPMAVLSDARARLTPPPIATSPVHQVARFSSVASVPDGPPPRV